MGNNSTYSTGVNLGPTYHYNRNWRDLGWKIIRYNSEWGNNNDYPTTIREILERSYTACSCRSFHKKFIVGQGFEDESLNKIKVNFQGLTAKKLLEKIAHSLSTYGYYGLNISYNLGGEISQIKPINSEFIRKGLTDTYGNTPMIAVYNDWQQRRLDTPERANMGNIDYINTFIPDKEVIAQQVAKVGNIHSYKGQMFVNWGEDADPYPKVFYDSVLYDMIAEHRMRSNNFERVYKNFSVQHLFFMDTNLGKEEAAAFQNGAREVMRNNDVAFMHNVNPEMVKGFPLSPSDSNQAYEYSEKSSRHAIIRAYTQPFALHSEQRGSSLSDSGMELVSAYQQYNSTTAAEREKITEDLEEIFSHFFNANLQNRDWKIKPLEFMLESRTSTSNANNEPNSITD